MKKKKVMKTLSLTSLYRRKTNYTSVYTVSEGLYSCTNRDMRFRLEKLLSHLDVIKLVYFVFLFMFSNTCINLNTILGSSEIPTKILK